MHFKVRFDGFEGLPAEKGRGRVESADFMCFGHKWCLRLWPGGDSSSGDGKVAVYLHHRSSGSSCVQFSFVVKESNGRAAAYYHCTGHEFPQQWTHWGALNFGARATILGALEDGALVIDLHMKLTGNRTGTSALAAPFVPANPSCQNALKKFLDEESADVVFEVSGDEKKSGRKKTAKISATTFHAHRFVLPKSGALAEACETSNDLTPIAISGIKPEIFRHVLYYLYGGAPCDAEMKENAKDIIDAADKFGIVGLKLAAEAAYVSSATITIENAIDNLLYADAKNCPLLQEAVMDFLVENGDESVEQLSFDNAPGYLLKDLLTAVNRSKKKESGGVGEELRTMRVSELRRALDAKGLDIDGSREVMIAALKEHS